MDAVKVRNVEIGTGIPKICVPIVGETRAEIVEAAQEITVAGADVVEWRADWYNQCGQASSLVETLRLLRDILGETPVLFTLRTAKEGGKKDISPADYVKLNQDVIRSGYVDLVDAELLIGDAYVRSIIETAHDCGVKVVVSNHEFNRTPKKEELIKRMIKMQELGADIPKIAVMPQNKKDVLTLLAATEEMADEHAHGPIITMSMAGTGVISRVCGEVFGSALTFGAVGKGSAPGQLAVKDLRTVLNLLHNSI